MAVASAGRRCNHMCSDVRKGGAGAASGPSRPPETTRPRSAPFAPGRGGGDVVTGDTDTPGFSGSVSVRPRSAASTASRETPGSPATGRYGTTARRAGQRSEEPQPESVTSIEILCATSLLRAL